MSRGRSEASRIMEYFQTASEDAARLMFGLVRETMAARFGKRTKAPKVARRQAKQPQSTDVAA